LTRILLDRNAVSTIKQKILPHRDRELRLLDKPNNLISPFLSIQEGNIGSQMKDKKEIEKLINQELILLKKFFKKAKIDIALSQQKELFINSFSEGMGTEKWNNYNDFLLVVNDLLYQPIAKIEQDTIKRSILKKANEFKVDLGHTIVICCLSTLYGCSFSRKILKFSPKNYNPYNALNDLITISRIAQIKAMAIEHNIKDKIEFFTFDKPLDDFFKNVTISSQKLVPNVGTEIEITFTNKLFPNLGKDEFIDFKKELSICITKQSSQ